MGKLSCRASWLSMLVVFMLTPFKVKTVDGVNELQIPPGTQPGDVIVLSKRGVPKLNKPSVRGDHLFTMKVTLPNRISGRERELLEEIAMLKDNRSKARTSPISKSQSNTGNRIKGQNGDTSRKPEHEESDASDNLWKKLKDFAGSVANGAITWLKNNL